LQTALTGGSDVSAPRVGQSVYFFLDWQLNGRSGSVTVTQRAMLDGAQYCSAQSTVSAGHWSSSCPAPWTVAAGNHVLQWDLNYNRTVAETNDNNNSAIKTFTPAGDTAALDIVANRAYFQSAP